MDQNKNEIRYNKLKKKGLNNPLNIMNRAIINLNNSRTNSESSQERGSKSRESSLVKINMTQSKTSNVEKKTKNTVAIKANYEEIISCLNQKQKEHPSSKGYSIANKYRF